MKKIVLLTVCLLAAGCAQQPQYTQYMTPAERTARMQAVAGIMANRPAYQPTPAYQMPTYRAPLQTNCLQAGIMVNCTTY